MLIMAYRTKTDTATAMPVKLTLLNVFAVLCAQNAEGAVLRASFEEQSDSNETYLNIAATSEIYFIILYHTHFYLSSKILYHFKKSRNMANYTLFPTFIRIFAHIRQIQIKILKLEHIFPTHFYLKTKIPIRYIMTR